MKLAIIYIISYIYGSGNVDTKNKEILKLTSSNLIPSEEFINSVLGICQNNTKRSIILLLEKNMDFKIQCYLFDIDQWGLLDFIKGRVCTLYQDTDISNVKAALDNLKQQYRNNTIRYRYEHFLRVSKGKLYIVFEKDLLDCIDYLANKLFKKNYLEQYDYKSYMNLIHNDKSNDEICSKIFTLKTRLLHYVCLTLKNDFNLFKEYLREQNEDTEARIMQYNWILENIETILYLLTKFDYEKEDDKKQNYLNVFGPFFKGIYGNEVLKKEDVVFHDYFKKDIFVQYIVRKFNQIKIVTSENDIQIREGFIEHILICLRKYLT